MIVNNTLVDLGGVKQSHRSEAIDFSGETGGEVENGGNSGIGENIRGGIGSKSKMSGDIVSGLRSIKSGDMATEVDALRDGFISLLIDWRELHVNFVHIRYTFEDIPNFGLANEYERHRRMRIHIEVEKKANFGKHLHIA